MKLPRKAAFFATIAAEAASNPSTDGIQLRRDLWLLSSQLYSTEANSTTGKGSYGWATLRAFCFDCLSRQGSKEPICLEAAAQLRSLLAELEPIGENRDEAEDLLLEETNDGESNSNTLDASESSAKESVHPVTLSTRTSMALEDADLQTAVASASQFAKNLRNQYTTLTAASPFLAQQSKWAHGVSCPSQELPLATGSPLVDSIVQLRSVWPHMPFGVCAEAQAKCLERMATLERAIAEASDAPDDFFSKYGFSEKTPPLYVSAATTIKAPTSLELDCVTKKKDSKVEEGSMATFYNPFAAKRSAAQNVTRVAEHEELAMMIKFGNRLSIPLEVQRGKLVFDNNESGRVKAAALSYTIPPNASSFVVHFPFTITSEGASSQDEGERETFEVLGIDLTCFGRSFFLPISALTEGTERQAVSSIPQVAANYPHKAPPKEVDEETKQSNPKVEAFPSQPRLRVCFAETGAPVETVTVTLSPGEVYTIPSLKLSTYLGPSTLGKIECLELSANGAFSGKLFDSNIDQPEEEDEFQFVKDVLFGKEPSAIKLRCLSSGVTLDGINRGDEADGQDNLLRLQIASSHDFASLSSSSLTVNLQFRYRGPCVSDMEVWRKKQVTLRIAHTKGPRISSLTLRPDLVPGAPNVQASIPANIKASTKKLIEGYESDRSFVKTRLGIDSTVSVCGNETSLLATIVNDTRSSVIVSRIEGSATSVVAGVSNLSVHPGVSARFPISIPKLDRTGVDNDVLASLVDSTVLRWVMYGGDPKSNGSTEKARGYIRLPASCLLDVVARYPAFVSQVCTPPCEVSVEADAQAGQVGKAITVQAKVQLASWVPVDIAEECRVSVRLLCSRDGGTRLSKDFAWAGKLVREFSLLDSDILHSIKLVFCKAGTYRVSACATISRADSDGKEVWWAPTTQQIEVPELVPQ